MTIFVLSAFNDSMIIFTTVGAAIGRAELAEEEAIVGVDLVKSGVLFAVFVVAPSNQISFVGYLMIH